MVTSLHQLSDKVELICSISTQARWQAGYSDQFPLLLRHDRRPVKSLGDVVTLEHNMFFVYFCRSTLVVITKQKILANE